jgi:tRNA pseudouridine55 synthase
MKHGYIVVDKPADWTSHDVVARVRRLVGERRVGHAGTLDPAATGVLPVAVGLATRTVEYLAASTKAYRAEITFGVVTDSADGEGEILARNDAAYLTLGQIEVALPQFRGQIAQRPPMHSAVKIGGKRLYQLARQGVEVDVRPRLVTIERLEVVKWANPVLTVDIECSKGTYIRSLARDLGEALEVGAHLSALRRTRTGPFTLADALTLEQLERELQAKPWADIALPPDAVLTGVARLDLTEKSSVDWGHGKSIDAPAPIEPGLLVAAYDVDGVWRGVGQATESGDRIRPTKVIPVE